MAQAKIGDTVKVHYTGKFGDGMVFDTSIDDEPLEFRIGESQVIPGFEEAVVGMNPGESKTVNIPVDKAYGPHRDDLVQVVDRKQLPTSVKPEIGQPLEGRQPDGEIVVATVTDVTESRVTLDANHPLAGKSLTFEIQLIEIV
ncbi:MAG: peptidylprolyl isomerase [Methanophagales archaeon]|jgi:peptidylprolyl isomerase|nr:peptidylprolyl isomerase [Methanophagales archaeon]NQE54929.1 FKBP-type peptidyl-prolyl cis-trans isomerase [ANME-1 cluster archaeon GoMg3.2]